MAYLYTSKRIVDSELMNLKDELDEIHEYYKNRKARYSAMPIYHSEWESGIHQQNFKKFERIAERVGNIKIDERGKIRGKLIYLNYLVRAAQEDVTGYVFSGQMSNAVDFLVNFCDYLLKLLENQQSNLRKS